MIAGHREASRRRRLLQPDRRQGLHQIFPETLPANKAELIPGQT